MQWTRDEKIGLRGPTAPVPAPLLQPWSSPSVPNSLFSSEDFMLSAGMVIIQPSTGHIVIINDEKEDNYWFLPKGRKNIGESLEQAALREAYEESGYKVEFLPLPHLTRATTPEGRKRPRLTAEPIYIELFYWAPNEPYFPTGGEYIAYWYVGQIADDAVHEKGTGMENESQFRTYLMNRDEALEKLKGTSQAIVVERAWALWQESLNI